MNCISFNPYNEFLLATGGMDQTVALWDLRNMKQRVHSFEAHDKGVFQVSWSPFNETILGSCSADRSLSLCVLSSNARKNSPFIRNLTSVFFYRPSILLTYIFSTHPYPLDVSISGTCPGSVMSKRQKMLRMGHQSCCSLTADILPR